MNARPDYEFEQEQVRDTSVVKIGDWMITILLLTLPIINIIYMIALLVSKSVNQNKKNYVLATIIFIVLFYVIGIGLFFGIFTLFGNSGGLIPDPGMNLTVFL